MDSINKNQPEENRENLNRDGALDKIKEIIKQSDTCFFCTNAEGGQSNGVRPMSIQQVDEQGYLWILLANDSHTHEEVAIDPKVKLFFKGLQHSDFLYLDGWATIQTDHEKVKELWNPILKTWFTEGENDPRIALIRIEPSEGYYWDTKHGNFVAGVKMMIGAAIGKTLDDSIEGKLKV